MISDDQLKRILSICEWHDELNRAYAVSEKILEQMATELLQFRETERLNNVKNEEDKTECTAHVWEHHPELSPHPYVCKVCGENMDENCFGDDL